MKFYVRVARQRTSDILFFRGILWKSLDPSGFSFRCYRSLSACKNAFTSLSPNCPYHNKSCSSHYSKQQTNQVHSAKFERWESWRRSSIRPLVLHTKSRPRGSKVTPWCSDRIYSESVLVSTVKTPVQLIIFVLFSYTSNLVQAVSFGTIGGSLWTEYTNRVCGWTPKALVD